MIGPNLSEWALSKRSLVVFLMILAVIAGTLSFTRLGRGEDPAFTFRSTRTTERGSATCPAADSSLRDRWRSTRSTVDQLAEDMEATVERMILGGREDVGDV